MVKIDYKKMFQLKKDKNGGYCITSYYGNQDILEIPEMINGKTITRIGDHAFHNIEGIAADFISVTIPKTVEIIDDSAFVGLPNLKKVTI